MAKIFDKVEDFTAFPGASASGTFRGRIPAEGLLRRLVMKITKGGALATLDEIRVAVTEIRFVLGNDDVRKIRAADYIAILIANGYTVEAGLLEYFFAEPWRSTVLDEEILSLDMTRYGAHVDCELDVTNTATPLSFEFDTEVQTNPKTLRNTAGELVPAFGMIDWTQQGVTVGSGVKSILLDEFPGKLQRLYIVTPAATTVSRVRVLRGMGGSDCVYDRTQTATNLGLKSQLKGMGMTIPAQYTSPSGNCNMWPVVPDNDQQLRNNLLDAGTRGRVEITLSAGADINIIRESLVAR